MHKASTRKAVPLSSHRKSRIHIPYCYYGMKARGPAQPTPALEDEVALAAGLPRPRSFGGVGLQVLQPRTRFLAKRLLRSPGQNSARGRCSEHMAQVKASMRKAALRRWSASDRYPWPTPRSLGEAGWQIL